MKERKLRSKVVIIVDVEHTFDFDLNSLGVAELQTNTYDDEMVAVMESEDFRIVDYLVQEKFDEGGVSK